MKCALVSKSSETTSENNLKESCFINVAMHFEGFFIIFYYINFYCKELWVILSPLPLPPSPRLRIYLRLIRQSDRGHTQQHNSTIKIHLENSYHQYTCYKLIEKDPNPSIYPNRNNNCSLAFKTMKFALKIYILATLCDIYMKDFILLLTFV